MRYVKESSLTRIKKELLQRGYLRWRMATLDLSPHKLETMFEEHVATLAHLALLAQAIRAPRSVRDATLPRYRELLRELLSELEVKVEAHFRFEESHLFPALRATGHAELAESLTLDHGALRLAAAPLLAHAHHALVENLTEQEWTAFGTSTMALIDRQRVHMQREESEMIPVLRALLPGDQAAKDPAG